MLASGQDAKALTSLRQALVLVTEYLRSTPCQQTDDHQPVPQTTVQSPIDFGNDSNSKSSTFDNDSTISTSIEKRNTVVCPYSFTEVEVPTLVDDEVYVCNKAIVYELRGPGSNYSSMQEIRFQSSIIIYNLALCFHNKGRMTQKTALLNRATRLYDKCHRSLQESIPENNINKNINNNGGMQLLLQLYSLNNLTQIRYDRVDDSYKSLLMPMAQIVQQWHGKMVLNIPEGVFLNIVMLRNLGNRIAPTA